MNRPSEQSGLHYLIELRTRLMYAAIALCLVFAVYLYFANDLYTLLALPLLRYLPQKHLIATQIVSPFFIPFKLAFLASIFTALPFFLYQIWGFISPALYDHERKLIWPFVFIGTSLFYLGLAFAYFVIFPLLFHFLVKTAPVGVMLSPDISEYFDFTTKMLLVFGMLFEIPILMVLLTALNVVTLDRYVKFRSYAIVGSFVLGMLLAPPDVISQTILAVPIWLLYECGIILTRFIITRRKRDT